jgi:hypothetical protein
MMGVLNIAVMLEYHKPDDAIRRWAQPIHNSVGVKKGTKDGRPSRHLDPFSAVTTSYPSGSRAASSNWVDEDRLVYEPDETDHGEVDAHLSRRMEALTKTDSTTSEPALKFAMQLTFTLLIHVMKAPPSFHPHED